VYEGSVEPELALDVDGGTLELEFELELAVDVGGGTVVEFWPVVAGTELGPVEEGGGKDVEF